MIQYPEYQNILITPSNGNIFRVTGPLWGEIHWLLARSFDVFFDLHLNKQLSKRPRRRWFKTPPRSFCRHCIGKNIWGKSDGRHYDDVTMSLMASQITSLTIVYSAVYSGADQRKHQSSASLAFVRGIHKGPVTWKMFPFDDVIMISHFLSAQSNQPSTAASMEHFLNTPTQPILHNRFCMILMVYYFHIALPSWW